MKKKFQCRKTVWFACLKLLKIMKISTVILFLATLQLTASTYSQSIDVNIKNGSLSDVLKVIESQTDYTIFYKDDHVNSKMPINLDIKEQNVEKVLDIALIGSNIRYSIIDNVIVLLKESSSQEITVSGVVSDVDGTPLPGVNIVEKGTTNGTVTNLDGEYTISVGSAESVLSFSFVGYLTEDAVVSGQTTINISLVEDIQSLDEVVVVGYGVQKKSVVTGAISSVKADDIENSSNTRIQEVLQGRASGVHVVSSSGAPGASMKIRIRGYSSNGDSDPLYIVDGLRTDDISGLEPSNIESMEVLKDGASAAIYGAEGGNGVVLITTKKGSAGKTTINYDFQYTIQSLGRTPEVMNAEQYIGYMEESGAIIGIDNSEGIDTKWIDESFEPSPMQKHNISFSGGTETTTYLGSISYLAQEGIVAGDQDKYKRFSGMFNGSQQMNKWLKFGSSMQLSRSVMNSFNEDDEYRGVISNAVLLDPLTPVEYTGTIPDRVQALIDAGQPLMQSEDGNYYGISEYVEGETINPFVQNLQSQTETTISKLMGNIYADITPFDGFTFTSKLGLNYYSSNAHIYKPEYYYSAEMLNSSSSVSETNANMTYWQWENYASYIKSIGNHSFTLMAGTAISSNELKTITAAGYPLLKDQESYANLDYVATQSNSTVGGNTIVDNKLSFFTRINYDFSDKYLFQATVRRDAAGLSILPKDNRWGTFPSVSAGWVISSEDFFPDNNVLSYLKLRGSWGQNGSLSNLGNYSYASTIASSGDVLSTVSWSYINAPFSYPLADGTYAGASYPSVLGNQLLTWETSEQFDIGLDFRFFEGRLTLTADYYKKTTKDLITENTPPLEAGNDASPINGGNVENSGLEFDLSLRNSIGELNYSISANLSTLNNKVTYLDPSISRIDGATVNRWTCTAFEKGMPVWYFRGYKTDGIDPTTGDINIVDINGDGEITTSDFTNIGSAIPDIMYGVNINLQYKAFDFTVFMQGQSGNDILMGMIRTDRPTTNKLAIFYEDRWTPTNVNAERPAADVSSEYWWSDQMVFDGSFLKIKQIQLGYTLPETVSQKLHVGKARLYVSLDDYFSFTDYPGMDPEAASTNNYSIGVDRGYFPISRKVLYGISLNF